MLAETVQTLLDHALQARAGLIDEDHETGLRLFNGFLEGGSDFTRDLLLDLYGHTLVLFNRADDPHLLEAHLPSLQGLLLERYPWVKAVITKTRVASDEQARRGLLTFGSAPDRKIREHGVWYALDLTLNLDASLYLDTRALRAWAITHLGGKRVLNTFAYTGSLGVAAMAAGASQVVQTDLNRRFLNLAKDSYARNGFPVRRADFLAGDFWTQMNAFKREGRLFDCIFVDPPFFSITERGRVDLEENYVRVINKVRPLVAHQGWLVAINNALFTSGAEYMRQLAELCADGYLSIEELIPVPPDCTGFPATLRNAPPVDPAPFNHSTKIALLRVRRKDERAA